MATLLPMVWDEPGIAGRARRVRGAPRARRHQERPVARGRRSARRWPSSAGPDAYVTPSWYATKREHGRVVPTWNYVIAHAHGRLVIHDDPAWLETNVRRLADQHEAGRAVPWSVDDAPRGLHRRTAPGHRRRRAAHRPHRRQVEAVAEPLGRGRRRRHRWADGRRRACRLDGHARAARGRWLTNGQSKSVAPPTVSCWGSSRRLVTVGGPRRPCSAASSPSSRRPPRLGRSSSGTGSPRCRGAGSTGQARPTTGTSSSSRRRGPVGPSSSTGRTRCPAFLRSRSPLMTWPAGEEMTLDPPDDDLAQFASRRD